MIVGFDTIVCLLILSELHVSVVEIIASFIIPSGNVAAAPTASSRASFAASLAVTASSLAVLTSSLTALVCVAKVLSSVAISFTSSPKAF